MAAGSLGLLALMVGRRRATAAGGLVAVEDPPPDRPAPPSAPFASPDVGDVPLRQSGRWTRSSWPPGTETQWRCEITWQSNLHAFSFRALAQAPGRARPQEIARSRDFDALPDAPPVPATEELCTAVDELSSALLAAGWRPAMCGNGWFADRFAWPGPGEPPLVGAPAPRGRNVTEDAR